MQKKELITDFTHGNVTKLLVKFAAPLFLANLLQIVYNMVDMVVVGNKIGDTGLSGVAIGGDILNLITTIMVGFASASQIIISQYIGAGQKDKIGKLVGTVSTFLAMLAVVLSVCVLIFKTPILKVMNTPLESWDAASAYATTAACGALLIAGYNIVSSILRGLGDSKHPFVFIAIAAGVNILLDLLFVYAFDWGTFGAALATVIGQGVSFACALIFLVKNKSRLGFEFERSMIRIHKENFSTLIKLGIPMSLLSATISLSRMFVASFINSYGLVCSAVNGIGNKMNTVAYLFTTCLSTSGSTMIAQNIGAQKYKRVIKILAATLVLALIIMVILSLVIGIMPDQIFMLFSKESDILPVAREFVIPLIIIFIGAAFRTPSFALIFGSGNSKMNFVVAILDCLVFRIGLSLLFGEVMGYGYIGFWYGDALAGHFPGIIAGIFLLSGKWKTNKHIVKSAGN